MDPVDDGIGQKQSSPGQLVAYKKRTPISLEDSESV